MEKILVFPAKNRRVYLSELNGEVPRGGYFVNDTEEVKRYIKEGLLEQRNVKKAPEKPEKPKRPKKDK